MKWLMLIFFAVVQPAFAEIKENEDRGGGSASDMLNMTKPPAAIEAPSGDVLANPRLSLMCTDGMGKQIKRGEPGYLDCMDEFKQRQQQPSVNVNTTTDRSKPNAAGVGIELK